MKKGLLILMCFLLMCGCGGKKESNDMDFHEPNSDELVSSETPETTLIQEETEMPEKTAEPVKTSRPKKTPQPSKMPVPSKEPEMTLSEIDNQVLHGFINVLSTDLNTDAQEDRLFVYYKSRPSIGVSFSYDEAKEIAEASDKSSILTSDELIERFNELDYSVEIYDKYYNTLKSSLNQDMKFKFQFQVINPYAKYSYSSNYDEFWSCIDEDHPIQLKIMIVLDNEEVETNQFDLDGLNEKITNFAQTDFDGTPVDIEIQSASVAFLDSCKEYELAQCFEQKSFTEDIHRVKKLILDEKDELLTRPDDGVYAESKVYYESEMKEIREKYIEIRSKEMDYDLSFAPYNEDFFQMYISSKPGVCEQIYYESAEYDLTQSNPSEWSLLHKNRFLLGNEVYDEWKDSMGQWLPEDTEVRLRLWISNPSADVVFTEDKERFYEATKTFPLSVMVYVLISDTQEGVQVEQFNQLLSDYIKEYFGDIAISGTICTAVSDEMVPEYMLREMIEGSSSKMKNVVKSSLTK